MLFGYSLIPFLLSFRCVSKLVEDASTKQLEDHALHERTADQTVAALRAQNESLSATLADTQARLRETEQQISAQQKTIAQHSAAKSSQLPNGAYTTSTSPAKSRIHTYDALTKTIEIFRGLQLPSVGASAHGHGHGHVIGNADNDNDPNFIPSFQLAADGSVPPAQIERALKWLREKVAAFKKIRFAFEASANAIEQRWALQHEKLMAEIDERAHELNALRAKVDRLTGTTSVPFRVSNNRGRSSAQTNAAVNSILNASFTTGAGAGTGVSASGSAGNGVALSSPVSVSVSDGARLFIHNNGNTTTMTATTVPSVNSAPIAKNSVSLSAAAAATPARVNPSQLPVVPTRQLFTPASASATSSGSGSSSNSTFRPSSTGTTAATSTTTAARTAPAMTPSTAAILNRTSTASNAAATAVAVNASFVAAGLPTSSTSASQTAPNTITLTKSGSIGGGMVTVTYPWNNTTTVNVSSPVSCLPRLTATTSVLARAFLRLLFSVRLFLFTTGSQRQRSIR
jgi:hypothetical protein